VNEIWLVLKWAEMETPKKFVREESIPLIRKNEMKRIFCLKKGCAEMDYLKDMTNKVADAAVSGVQKVGDVTKAGYNAAKDGVVTVSDGVVSGATKVGGATMSGLEIAKDGAMAGVSAAKDGVGSVAGGLSSSLTTMTVLKAETKAKIIGLSPLQVAKVGRVITNMKTSEYQFSDDEIDTVVRAIYVSQSDSDLQEAFDMLDKKLNGNVEGRLKGSDFRVVLPLVGEDVPPEKVAAHTPF
jgi:hypothetical protein